MDTQMGRGWLPMNASLNMGREGGIPTRARVRIVRLKADVCMYATHLLDQIGITYCKLESKLL